MTALIAIVGRPNVGKSTLFNRLCGVRVALVDPTPGVTRDRRFGDAKLGNLNFEVIDTAGLEEATKDSIEAGMQHQTDLALEQADGVLLLIDARAGVTPLDRHFAEKLRRAKVPVILVANKCEGGAGKSGLYEAYELGLGDPVSISAEHGQGLADLHEALIPIVPLEDEPIDEFEEFDESGEDSEHPRPSGPLQLAIVGRPNVGKSTLLNRLVGEERVLTGPEPGVTRDSISVQWAWRDRPVKLVDTAGMRRRARVTEKLELMSVADTLRAVRFANVAVLVLDGTVMAERQDLTIADHVIEEGRALVIAVNKWDLVTDTVEAMSRLRDRLQRSLPQIPDIPVVTFSALTGRGIEKLMPAVFEVYDLWNTRLSTGPLNRWLEGTLERHPPPLSAGRRLRLRYITQIKARPPTFVVFASRPVDLPESYRRYLVNGLRKTFGLSKISVRLILRQGKNPYVGEDRSR
ncbi:MAG: GTP-binding protein [Alphaproteobacteria bacterium]|jgi:GTP-binding protein